MSHPGPRPGVLLAGAAAVALLSFGLLFDALRGRPFALSLPQVVAVWFGLVALLESLLQARGRAFPALWREVAGEGAVGRRLTLLLAFALLGLLAYVFRVYEADDAFITFRFARHLAEGAGLAWNPGEPPVEGYSNFLWMLLAAAAHALRLDPMLVVRAAALLCLAASLFVVRRLTERIAGTRAYANLPVLLLAATPAFSYWAMSGLETVSVVLLALLYFDAFAAELAARRPPVRTALYAVLLLLSRPDTPLLLAGSGLPLLLARDRAARAWIVRVALLAAGPFALYLGWKWLTFARIMPNTVAAKWSPLAGVTLLTDFLAVAFPLVLLAALRRGRMQPVERAIAVAAALYALALVNSQPHVGHFLRFFLPVLAPMLVWAALAARDATAAAGAAAAAPVRLPVAVPVAALLYTLAPLYAMAAYAGLESRGLERAHVTVARLLARHYPPTGVLAASDCGVIPYLTRMRTIDIWGLSDRVIAERGFDPGYVMAQQPDVVIVHGRDAHEFAGREPYDRELQAAVARDPAYRKVGAWLFVDYWLWVYAKKDLPAS